MQVVQVVQNINVVTPDVENSGWFATVCDSFQQNAVAVFEVAPLAHRMCMKRELSPSILVIGPVKKKTPDV